MLLVFSVAFGIRLTLASGGSREWGQPLNFGRKPIILQVAKNCMKMNEIERRGGVPSAPWMRIGWSLIATIFCGF